MAGSAGPARTGVVTKGISLRYDGRTVLDHVDLHLKKGEVITLLGPNGCGKTTLLKVINGLLRPDQGEVYVDGKDVSRMGQMELARFMGYVPQNQRQSFPFTALDIVLTGRMPHLSVFAQPGTADIEKARRALDMVGALHLASRPYTQISGGERQLVMIARALAQEPSFLLLDEPTSSLDFKNQVSVLKMISRISREENVTVIMTLHDPNHAMMFSDEVVLLRKLLPQEECRIETPSHYQNVIASGKPHEVMTPESIRAAYGIDVEVLEVHGRRILFPL